MAATQHPISGSNFQQLAKTYFSRSLEKIAAVLERHPTPILALLFLLYLWILKSERTKPLWHDELFTYYIAQAPTFHKMIEWTQTIDLNPPLYYIAARLTFHVIHPGIFSVRFPSMVAYFVATLCLYIFVRRRLTPLYGCLAALVMLSSEFNIYSYEARPYAMVLGFAGILALSWQRAIDDDKSRSWVALLFVAIGGFGMLLSHILASVAYAAFLVTEAIRFAIRRKPNWLLWICLAIPLSACITYFHPMQNHDAGTFPQQFQASILQLLAAYSDLWIGISSLIGVAIIVIVLLTEKQEPSNVKTPHHSFIWPEIILALGLCCVPLVVIMVFMHSHSAYFPRYGIPAIFGASILVPWFIARWTGTSSRSALICCLVFIFGVVTPSSLARHLQNLVQREKPKPASLTGESNVPLSKVMVDLPLVDASGLTFLEMNSRENTAFLSRVYYLNDMEAAIQYSNATIFEGFPYLKNKFPIRAHIEPYRQFIQQHSKFLVLGTYNYPEDWILRKLLADHATLRFLGDYSSGYKDEQLYEVTLDHR